MANEIITIEKLTRLINRLKPKAVSDITVSDNKLNVKMLDNTTKELTLPSGGSQQQTRSVTRLPLYFEFHFNNRNSDAKLGVDYRDVKSLFKFCTLSEEGYDEMSEPNGIISTDVTSTKKRDDNDTVILLAVNMYNPRMIGESHAPIKIYVNKSFGNIMYPTTIGNESTTVPTQVYGAVDEISVGGGGCSEREYKNYFVIDVTVGEPRFAWELVNDSMEYIYDEAASVIELSEVSSSFVNETATFTEVL